MQIEAVRPDRKSAPAQNTPPLRSVRLARGLTIKAVAHRSGIDPAHLSRVERGEKVLSLDAMYRLAVVLGLTEFAAMLRLYLPEQSR